MSKIEDAIRRLSPEQRALLELRLQQKRQESPAQNMDMAQRPDLSVFPLSAGQRRLLALEQLFPDSPQYNITVAFRLGGPISPEALHHGIRRVLERHEVLRGRYSLLNGAWQQMISDIPGDCLRLIDVSQAPETQRLQQATTVVKRDLHTPFDLATGPLLRAGLVKIAADDHIFFVTVHHIAADAWSINLILQELATLYQARLSGLDATLPELHLQYADYAFWQTSWLQSEEAATQLNFWKDTFTERPAELQLPFNRNPKKIQSVKGATQSAVLSGELTEALKALSLDQKLTPYTLFLAAFKALLFRYTAQHEMIVCSPVAGRRRVEVEPLAGYFNNIIAVRSSLSEETTYRELADHISSASMQASDNQEIPFEVVADLPELRGVSLTKALFTFQDALHQHFDLPNVTVQPFELDTAGADFDLSMFVEQKGEDVVVVAEYKKELFEEGTIAGLLANYLDLLEIICETPHVRLDALPSFEAPVIEPDPAPAISLGDISVHANVPVTSGDELPVNTVSKTPATSHPAPADELEQILTRIWQRSLGLSEVGLHDNFFEIGGHSLMAVNIFNEIQKYVGELDLPLAVMLEAPTIASLARRIRNSETVDWSPLAVIQSGRSSLPLFCIHGAGGNVLLYRDLAIQLGPDQTVYGLQSQGMDGQRPILARIEDMAALYVKAMRKALPSGPYLIVGYCMGGVVALEVAQQLRKAGQEVALLAMLESYNWKKAPKETRWMKWQYFIEKILFHIRNYFLLSGYERKLFRAEKVAELKRRRKVWYGKLMNAFRSKKRIEAQTGGSNLRALAEVWRTNDESVHHYTPAEYHGRIMHFLPLQEYSYHKHENMDWCDIAHKIEPHVLSVYPGGMLVQPFVKELAQSLRAEIFHITMNHKNTNQSPPGKNGVVAKPHKSIE